MNLDVLKSRVHYSRWGNSAGSISLSFDVIPEGREQLDIGDKYVFASSGYARLLGNNRRLIGASVSVTADRELLEHVRPLLSANDRPICGWASFHDERQSGTLDYEPPSLQFNVVVEPEQFAAMLNLQQSKPAGATLHIGLEELKFGWEPDGTHLIWELSDQASGKRPISTFSYTVERLWTSETAIRKERDRKLNAELADSPDPADRKLAESANVGREPEPLERMVKQCRALLAAILLLGGISALKLMT